MFARFIVPCLALLASLPAEAQTIVDDVPTVIINYSDLNLGNDAGIAKLYARIKFAAKEVCETPQVRSGRAFVEPGCIKHAIERAVADVQSSRLTTLYSALISRR